MFLSLYFTFLLFVKSNNFSLLSPDKEYIYYLSLVQKYLLFIKNIERILLQIIFF